MAKDASAGAGETPPGRGLPDEIVIWEILVRLPPNSLLRCRAVCHAWRAATSTRYFLLAHHGHQPSLPIICSYGHDGGGHRYQSFFTFNHRAADAQPQRVARLGELYEFFRLEDSCGGLFILSISKCRYSVHNPTTHQYARLKEIDGFNILGMYQHGPTGEYRLLLYWFQQMAYGYPASNVQDGSYVFSLGSGQPPRHIGCPEGEEVLFHRAPLLFRGSLHWHLSEYESGNKMMMVFNTTDESFRQMLSPVDDGAILFEMEGMLGMYKFMDAATNIDIWVLQDYENEVWAFKCRVELPVAEIRARFEKLGNHRDEVVVTSCDGDVFVLVRFGEWIHQVDIDGKLVASFHCEGLEPTQLRLKQTVVPHTFFPAIDG